ncbi:hypothetical protein L7F22_039641 [Adiantum nelumboides]|nr:hypothetical protein [Adiantum nelumboides]
MPKVFNNLDNFLRTFPISATHGSSKEHDGDVKLLRTILNVFMLRRTKSALVQNKSLILPSLSEVTIMARLVPLQRDVYLSVLKKELPKLLQKHGVPSQASLQNIVVQLRKACSHPYLFDGIEPEPFEEGDHLIKASGKLMVLDSILQSLRIRKNRVLIYAQMTRTLDILQDYLEFRKYVYERLDGSVRAEERFVAARKFNAESIISDDKEGSMDTTMPFVFLLTTRAGGVGLNLTAADTVIFYEQDWNPQADKQAVQRAHRIGQTKPVLAINLVTENTVDEVILSRAKKKLKLTNELMGSSNPDVDEDGFDKARPSDLQSLIIFGLDKLHADTIHSSTEDESMPHIARVVQQALEQRGKLDNDERVDETGVSEPELEENLYAFDGQDFTPKKRKDVDGTDACELVDQAALSSWIQRLDLVSSDQEVAGRRGRKRSIGEAVTAEEDLAAKQQKVEAKQRAKWDSLGYTSLAVQDPGEVVGDLQTESDESKVHFVFGDCTKPSIDSNAASVIFSVVDNSGVWGSGGMFSALSKLSPHIQKAYEAAHEAGDLHVGDLHLISVDAGDDKTQKTQADEDKSRYWVGLGIAQSYDRRRKSPRSDIALPALEVCLRKTVGSAAAISASIHMPRISSRPGQERREWYAIERLLQKHASRKGVPIYVYYYKRPD